MSGSIIRNIDNVFKGIKALERTGQQTVNMGFLMIKEEQKINLGTDEVNCIVVASRIR